VKASPARGRCHKTKTSLAEPPIIPSNSRMPATRDPEYRRCPVSGRWVIIAPVRSQRPLSLDHARPHHRERHESDPCPFCEGAEHDTPHESYAVRRPGTEPNGPGWSLRVVPNKYPAVNPSGDAPDLSPDGSLFESVPGVGAHELVIECARHEANPVKLTDDEFAAVLAAYRHRLVALATDPRWAYATVFKNVGAEAGASLAHVHSQIVATPVVPDAVRLELDTSADYHRVRGRCVFCDVIREETSNGVRVVAEGGGFVALAPFAPRFAYEVWVLPTAHDSRYESLTDAGLRELARLLKRVLGAVDKVLARPAYNYFLHTAPLRAGELPHYHWHVEIVPRTARAAGFEWGSGCFINAVPPERAAASLREALR
jgi:UDPglucose--hexose-1-phosphate uridylyltransferase